MALRRGRRGPTRRVAARSEAGEPAGGTAVSASTEQLLLEALQRGGDTLETGRYLVTYREGMAEEGAQALRARAFRMADARDFAGQAVTPEDTGDAEALNFPEIGVALVSGTALATRGMGAFEEVGADSPIEVIEPEYFVFADSADYLRGFLSAANAIARDLKAVPAPGPGPGEEEEVEPEVLGATWGLIRCRVPWSTRSGLGIKVAVLDTGMDLGHADFHGRAIFTQTFVGQPVQDLHGHGTHCIGTATGPKAPAGSTPRYGIAHASQIFVGKVLTNSGSGTGAGVLAGMNWAIANRCQVISMSLGSQSPVQAAYTAAGSAALANGCLIIAAAGNAASTTGAPANSPTIMSVASLDPDLAPSSFSNFGKIEIAAPGRDVFSSWPRPIRYRTISGTSMATPHVAGCAALWAQTSTAMRGMTLWRKLQSTARRLPFPAARVGAGLVQAP
ncbi:S8 family serine peptidase [Elioraea sp. Yellowstone]|jgi:subtilisin|uniref:S8 family serine peptidase n=1 Tax=Elioraea sp. Yellowstone TaxID=2592070 RepID=UPI001153CC45|nr:S8 family serine peptidase [Elioraea sp. Yellowstone]TQF76805.1 S8 family serine peptidase [Elioraea sp. Yellowstone]